MLFYCQAPTRKPHDTRFVLGGHRPKKRYPGANLLSFRDPTQFQVKRAPHASPTATIRHQMASPQQLCARLGAGDRSEPSVMKSCTTCMYNGHHSPLSGITTAVLRQVRWRAMGRNQMLWVNYLGFTGRCIRFNKLHLCTYNFCVANRANLRCESSTRTMTRHVHTANQRAHTQPRILRITHSFVTCHELTSKPARTHTKYPRIALSVIGVSAVSDHLLR